MQFEPLPIVLDEVDSPCKDVQTLINKGVYLTSGVSPTSSFYLAYPNNRLTLYFLKGEEKLRVSIDFVTGQSKHRRQYGGGKNQPLAKACGLDKHPNWTILDATAGLGKDAFVLASLGAHITLCEYHPALYGLLIDALYRAQKDEEAAPIVEQMKCVHANSIEHLESLDDKPDVIYLDPMYPERKKSAKIKKEMQILQQLVGHTGDDFTLCELALKTAKHRVVVKRPKSATPLIKKVPSYIVASINTRYDVYVL